MKLKSNAIPILMYHHVSNSPGMVTISPETFEAQMRYLTENGFCAITPEALDACLRSGRPVPEKSVLLTFDDGYLDNYVFAYPILKRYGLQATLFAITGWLGDGPPRDPASVDCLDHVDCALAIRANQPDKAMTRWSEIEKMIADGTFNVHSHTHSHQRFDKSGLPKDAMIAALDADLVASKAALKKRLGIESPHLCWPQGYYDANYIAAAKANGFSMLYTTEKRPVMPGCDPSRLGRVVIKDKAGFWFASRLWIYSRPTAAKWYLRLRGDGTYIEPMWK